MHTGGSDPTVLSTLSDQLANAVERAGQSVVRVEARRGRAGSGVAWSADGLILTADHVLERDEDLVIGLPDGRRSSARIVGRDPGTDLALLRVEGAALTPAEQASAPRVGQLVLVVARPDRSLATSLGVVGALGGPVRTWRGGRLASFISTDAIFYPGYSGGPLVDVSGRMLGLATSRFGRGQGAGLAIPLESVKQSAEALLSHGRIRRGYLGISSQPVALPAGLRGAAGLEQETGLLIVGVESGGPAERGGLLVGDILVTLGGEVVGDTDDLRDLLGPERLGQTVPTRVIRGGQPHDLSLTVGERP